MSNMSRIFDRLSMGALALLLASLPAAAVGFLAH